MDFLKTLNGRQLRSLQSKVADILILDVMIVLVTSKNADDPIKNEGARVVTRLYVDFFYTKGQITS